MNGIIQNIFLFRNKVSRNKVNPKLELLLIPLP